jgi:uncharacterized protein (UPF0332 family)
MENAQEMLDVAEELLRNNHGNSACNRAYYGVFYAASALLYAKGKSFGKHSAVLAAFRQYFIKTGEFDKRWSDDYKVIMESPHTADYELYDPLEKEDVVVYRGKGAGICRGSQEMAAKTRPALKLSSKEKKAVREFITTVRLAYGDKIQRAALFGSKVRGDDTKYSDVDILLIVADDK